MYAPELIGLTKGCKYRNVGGAITDINKNIEALTKKFEPYVNNTVKTEITASKQAMKVQFKELRDKVENQFRNIAQDDERRSIELAEFRESVD